MISTKKACLQGFRPEDSCIPLSIVKIYLCMENTLYQATWYKQFQSSILTLFASIGHLFLILDRRTS